MAGTAAAGATSHFAARLLTVLHQLAAISQQPMFHGTSACYVFIHIYWLHHNSASL